MENRLRAALDNGQFLLHYQPKVSLGTGAIAGVEALLRWQDPENGLISPAAFLPMLESAGLMAPTDAWVLKQAAADCREWRRKGLPPIPSRGQHPATAAAPAQFCRRDSRAYR